MGLIIKGQITIQGTEIELPEVYGRLEFAGRSDGKTLEIAVATYASKSAFTSGASIISTNVQQGNMNVELKAGEMQSIETAHQYAQQAFEQLGYTVEIDM